MNFLKKIGQVLAKGVQIYLGLKPFIPGDKLNVAEAIMDKVELIHSIIIDVEAVGEALKLTGAQKLEMATLRVTQLILSSSALAGRKPANETEFREAIKDIVNGHVRLLNSLKADNIDQLVSENLVN